MGAKRAGGGASSSSSSDHAVLNALLVAAALGGAFSLLVRNGRLTWPPVQLLSGLATIAGCLALVGPLILARSGRSGGSLGELVWMTGGLLIWIFDVVGVIGGNMKWTNWATPLGERTMGLIILAVLIAGMRSGLAGKDWSWTNVTGWALGLFWVGLAFSSWLLTSGSWGATGLVLR
ncbi:hypothetical protein [Paludisphaera borealis]|uniref:hypothetical protein n=1 Tax=Paludisphaera borealis TaxID=1387353 RepID=UPI000970B220|nr:hypothetical protein [Paludisphaera borealis]